jgi:hypothetical protein
MATPFPDVKPFPSEASQSAAPIGHNRPDPSVDAVKDFDDALDQREGFRDRIDQLIAASERAVCIDQDTAGRCADLGKQIAAAAKVVEDARTTVKQPYLEAGRAVDNAARVIATPLTNAGAKVKGKLDTFLREERAKAEAERRRQEEARRAEEARIAEERAKAEAEGRAAPEPEALPEVTAPAEAAPVRGDYGSLATARTIWKSEITDYTLAFMAVENNEKVREAIDKAIAALVRSGVHKIDGVKIYEDQTVSIR